MMRYVKGPTNVGRYVTNGVNTHSYVAAPAPDWMDEIVDDKLYHAQFGPPPLSAVGPSANYRMGVGARFGPHPLQGCSACGFGADNPMAELMASVVPGAPQEPGGTALGASALIPLAIAGVAVLIFWATLRKGG